MFFLPGILFSPVGEYKTWVTVLKPSFSVGKALETDMIISLVRFEKETSLK